MTMLAEQRISLTALAQREGVNVSTVWRWTKRGVEGIRLQTFSIGSRRWTSQEAFHRWVAAVTAAKGDGGTPDDVHTNRSRDAAVSTAERELAASGF